MRQCLVATALEVKATLINTSLGGWRAQAFQNCQEANLITLKGRAALSVASEGLFISGLAKSRPGINEAGCPALATVSAWKLKP